MSKYKISLKQNIGKLFSTGFFHVFGSTVINKILAFLSSVMVLRFVTKAQYGVYTAALNYLSFFLLATALGMVSGVLQLCSENYRNKEKAEEIYRYGCSVGIRFNFILALIIAATSFLLPEKVEGSNTLLLYLAFIPFVEVMNGFQKIYFRSHLKNREYGYINTLNTALVVAFTILGAYIFKIKGIIIGRYIAGILTFLLTKCIFDANVYIRRYDLDRPLKIKLFRISLISMVNNGLSSLLFIVDVFTITMMISDAHIIADYKVGIIIPTALLFIPGAVTTYIYPYFSSHIDDGPWLRSKFKKLFLLSVMFNGLITLLIILFAPLIVKIAFGAQYLTTVPIFRIASLSFFSEATFRIIAGTLLVTQNKLTFNLKVAILTCILNIISNICLIKYMGSIGAAISTFLVMTVTGIISTVYYISVIRKK